ncbi:hypothetical protein BDN72DRAFT_902320 [Pluteus cervinus]|uniref:Uncharacterized protein n=1 Tax=Pluteus cervinus TaxID=181527 RepID=A0ACD3ACD6_9AGAR|nr:hypothetical protein BDN72DRAFT_902320 [Pluteus cervinus]
MGSSSRFAAFISLSLCLACISSAGPVLRDQIVLPSSDLKDTVSSVVFDGTTYGNKGLVAFGFIPHDFKDSTGDTVGGIGSAIALKHGSWKRTNSSAFSGTFIVHPDRGYNVVQPIDYQSRHHEVDFNFFPYSGSAPLSFEGAQKTFQPKYVKTVLKVERDNKNTTGLDALSVRAAQKGFDDPNNPQADPALPVSSTQPDRLTLDVEGIVANPDGSFWISEEYGPYIYLFSADGHLLQSLQPPEAILPLDSSGKYQFTSLTDPATGRRGNHGFESLTMDPTNQILYAMLQSATIQDGGDKGKTSRNTRLLAYDIHNPNVRPELVGEWIVPLPLDDDGKAIDCNEMHFVSPGVFLILTRDGDGRGGDKDASSYKHFDLFSIAKATDIHGSKYDSPDNSILKKKELVKDITPAEYVSFIDFIAEDQLARFGLHNGLPSDNTAIDAKWESLALIPVGPEQPDDYFLFTFADNDFKTTNGFSAGAGGAYNAGIDVDNQVLVYQVTVPGVPKDALCEHLGIVASDC